MADRVEAWVIANLQGEWHLLKAPVFHSCAYCNAPCEIQYNPKVGGRVEKVVRCPFCRKEFGVQVTF